MASIGLVLGAGGAVGRAYHAGVLAALEEHAGWDAREADVIVGTSAGSSIGSSLRAGITPADHLARATGKPLSPAGQKIVGDIPVKLPLPSRPHGLRPIPVAPRLVLHAVLRREWPRPGLAFAGLLPRGTEDGDVFAATARKLHPKPWPDQPLWACAVRLKDGRLSVFGRDAEPTPDIGKAVQASSAIPAFFEPVRIDGDEYVDGGVHSPTNADLVAGLGLDLVIVSSPMSAHRSALLWYRPGSLLRGYHGSLLRREIAAVKRSGTPVLVFEPGRHDLAEMGTNPMDPHLQAGVARQAHRSARALLERPSLSELLAHLGADRKKAATGT